MGYISLKNRPVALYSGPLLAPCLARKCGARLPVLFFGVLAGVVADHYSRKAQLIIAQVVNAILNFILATLILTGGIQTWHVYVTDFLDVPWAVTIMGTSCFLLTVGIAVFVPDLWKSKLLPTSEKVAS